MKILGISAYYHDSAAALLVDGVIVAAAQEERFSRKKHDARFPHNAVRYCLHAGGLDLREIDHIVFYEKPLLTFERLLETYLSYAPRGFGSFLASMPVWLKQKLYLKTLLKQELAEIGGCKPTQLPSVMFTEHHQAHAAAAFFPSPFEQAAVLCLDAVGEWATTSAWLGQGNQLTLSWELNFPHSLGMLYSAFTYYAGFKVNSGEYKLMGLAPYGEPKYAQLILEHLIDLKPDGTFRLNMEYFNFATGLTMTNKRFDRLFGGAPRKPESKLNQRDMDLAASVQQVTEEIVFRLGCTLHKELQQPYLCMAGGVALNCVANGRLLRKGPFKDIWVQPAAGDAGSAVGSALALWYQHQQNPRSVAQADGKPQDMMQGAYLGPSFSQAEVEGYLDAANAVYQSLGDDDLLSTVAGLLAAGNVVGWFQGRMEFGPRALGDRSILGDPRSPAMQSVMNQKIKFRESFRPFAPSILAERVSDYFDIQHNSPYMLMVAPVHESQRVALTPEQQQLQGFDGLKVARSTIPAVTHVDQSARVQTVHPETNPRYYGLLKQFEQQTQTPILINTSFNVRGEPIVCTPEDAYRCFMRTAMDYLVVENCLLDKEKQPDRPDTSDWQTEFELD